MGWKIDWTEPALDDLAGIVRYIADDAADAAISVGDRIVDHVAILQEFPEIGPIYRRKKSGDVRQILSSPFKIYYRIRKDRPCVEILHVWHAARLNPSDI